MANLMVRLLFIGTLVLSPFVAPPAVLPTSLGPLKLLSWLEGDEARRSINKLHRRRIPMVSGYVAQYGATVNGRKAGATLWASQADDEEKAESLLQRMVKGLKRGNPAFGHYRSWRYGDRIIHEVVGNGQMHWVFRNSHWVVWLAADPHLPPSVLEEALEVGRTPPPKPIS